MNAPSPAETPPAEPVPAEPAPSHGFGSRIRNYFLTGLIVTGPVTITAWLIWSLVTWVDDVVRPFIPLAYRPETYLPLKIPGFGLIIGFITLTILGFLTANLVGRTLVEFGETLLERMPIVRPLYRGLKQVFETLFSQSGSTFRKVGLIEFPAPGMWSLVFMSNPPGAQMAAELPAGEHVSVFMPCTPNPTTGFFIYVPRDKVIELDIPVEAAAKLIMTAGMIQPGVEPPQRALSALAEQARAIKNGRTMVR